MGKKVKKDDKGPPEDVVSARKIIFLWEDLAFKIYHLKSLVIFICLSFNHSILSRFYVFQGVFKFEYH